MGGRRFSPHEDGLLRQQWGMQSAQALASELGRSVNSVRHRASRLGLGRPASIEWTPEEDRVLAESVGAMTYSAIGLQLGRSEKSVMARSQRLGLSKGQHRSWTASDIDFLEASHQEMAWSEIAAHLHRSSKAVARKAQQMGLAKYVRRDWMPSEDEYLLANPETPIGDLGRALDRSRKQVSWRRRMLDLEPATRRVSQYKPSSDGRPVVAIRDGVRVMEHRQVAEEQLGRPLRAGEVVHHIDLDKTNNSPSNLVVCESRSEHRLVHVSIEQLVHDLMHDGLVIFDRSVMGYRRATGAR